MTVNRSQSKPAFSLVELEPIRAQVVSRWKVAQGAKSKDRIKQALNRFIEAISKHQT